MATPRLVILGLGISLDGYIARRDGRVDFLVMDPDHDWTAFFKRVDTWLLGRKTLDDAIKMQGGGTKRKKRAPKFDSQGLRTIVFSRTLAPGAHEGFEVTSEDPVKVVRDLRKTPGKHLWLGGGGELAKAFLTADLVDRIELGVVPTLIGDGIPLFPAGFPERTFRLVEAKTYPKTGLLAVTYDRIRSR